MMDALSCSVPERFMKVFLLSLCFLALAPFALPQAPTVSAQPNTVFVGADGKFETAPDTAVLQFNINAQADSAKEAYALASQQAEKTREVLRANGIDPKTAEIGFYSTNPMYDWKNPKRRIVGYQVSTSVSLKLKDFSKVAPITQQLAESNVGDSQSLSYALENIDQAKAKAVADAYRRAHASADALASASGRSVGELSYASVDTFENIHVAVPQKRVMAMSANAAPAPTEEFTPQNVTVTARVNAMFTLK